MRYFRVVDKVHFIQEVSHFLNYVIPAVIESKKKQYTMIHIIFTFVRTRVCVQLFSPYGNRSQYSPVMCESFKCLVLGWLR